MNIDYIDVKEPEPIDSFNNCIQDKVVVSIEAAEELCKPTIRVSSKQKKDPFKAFLNKQPKQPKLKILNPEKTTFATLDDYLIYHGFK